MRLLKGGSFYLHLLHLLKQLLKYTWDCLIVVVFTIICIIYSNNYLNIL